MNNKDVFEVFIFSKDDNFLKSMTAVIANLQLNTTILNTRSFSNIDELNMHAKGNARIILFDEAQFADKIKSIFSEAKVLLVEEKRNLVDAGRKLLKVVSEIKKEDINKAGKSFLKRFLIGLVVLCTILILIYTYYPDYIHYVIGGLFAIVVGKQVFKALLAVFNKHESKASKKLECL